jgi:predicted GNAT family N-acyltransferase
MEGPRAPKADEFGELVKFLDHNLRQEVTWSVTDEYPTTLNTQNLHNFRIIKDEEKILSHAVVKPIIVKTRRGLFKVACIGSVVTSESHRNQGLSNSVINDCLETAKEQGCDFAILWSDLYEFYRKMGFELAGQEVSLLIDAPLKTNSASDPGAINFKFEKTNRVDPQVLFRLYSQHSVSSIRTLEDFEKYLKIPNSRLYTARNNDGKIDAYAVEGKGADLQGYIHEWGGTLDGIIALLAHIRKELNTSITLISPSHAQNLIRRLESLGAKKIDGYLGFIKITNENSFFNKVIRNARQEWGQSQFILEKRGDFYFYGIGENLFKTDQLQDIVKLIFGPKKPSQLHDAGAEMNAQLDRMFPIEMWIWGWDSV